MLNSPTPTRVSKHRWATAPGTRVQAKARRRAAGKVARASRRINRGQR
jgi:hypothetical protein